jgi:hypothetical protein
MLIFEVENKKGVDSGKLMALSQFLSGRAKDTDGKKQISTTAFVALAQSLGINVTADTLGDLIAKAPLSNTLQPYDPNSNVVSFKGNEESPDTAMSPDQAAATVNSNAKAAMNRRS